MCQCQIMTEYEKQIGQPMISTPLENKISYEHSCLYKIHILL